MRQLLALRNLKQPKALLILFQYLSIKLQRLRVKSLVYYFSRYNKRLEPEIETNQEKFRYLLYKNQHKNIKTIGSK